MSNDLAYQNSDFIPGGADYPDRWAEEAQAYRALEASLGRARLNAPYGAHPREAFDLFYPAGRPDGLLVFVHGGYWHLFDRGSWSHFARGATARGWAVAIPSYPLCPEVRIAEITRSVAAAVTTAAGHVAGPLTLAGHSAGGHLVARMACADAPLAAAVAARIAHVAAISPLGDLRPLIDTSMNADLGLDAAAARAESPALLEKAPGMEVSVWVGADERPAFLGQAQGLSEAWGASLHVLAGRHHFDVIDGLADPESEIVRLLTRAG